MHSVQTAVLTADPGKCQAWVVHVDVRVNCNCGQRKTPLPAEKSSLGYKYLDVTLLLAFCLFFLVNTETLDPPAVAFDKGSHPQVCAGTAALTVNWGSSLPFLFSLFAFPSPTSEPPHRQLDNLTS